MVAQCRGKEYDKNIYGIRHDGGLMPGTRKGLDEQGNTVIASPSGVEYSFAEDHTLTVEEAEALLRRDKIAAVASTYNFEQLTCHPTRVLRCSHPAKKKSSYILVEAAGGWTCTCPSWEKSDVYNRDCKHVQAVYAHEHPASEEITNQLVAAEVYSHLMTHPTPAALAETAPVEDDLSDLMQDGNFVPFDARASKAVNDGWDGTAAGW